MAKIVVKLTKRVAVFLIDDISILVIFAGGGW